MRHSKPLNSTQHGSVLIAVIIITSLISIVMSSFLTLTDQQVKQANKAFYYNACLDLAESGIEDAIWAINNDDYSEWATNGTNYWKQIDNFSLNGATSVQIRVMLTNLTTIPTIISEGQIDLPGKDQVSKQIKVQLSPRSKFPNGLTAKNTITFSGGNADVDAYDSDISSLAGNRLDEGTVATVSALNDSVNISNASIFGYIATGGSPPDIGPNGKVYGADRVTEVEFMNNSSYFVDTDRITNDFSANFEDILMPAISTAPLPSTNTTIGDATGVTIEAYEVSDLNIRASDTLTIVGPVVLIVTDDVDVKGEIVIDQAKGSLEMYVADDITVTGNGIVNLPTSPGNSPLPNKLLIYGTAAAGDGQIFKLAGNGALVGGVYAPHAAVELKGGGSSGIMYGAVLAEQIKITGNYQFRYDIRMKEITDDASFRMISWTELISQSNRFDFLAYF